MSALDDVNAAIATLNTVAAELSVPAVESTADQFLASAVSTLTAAGYTVTPPTTPDDNGPETPAEESSDPSTEA